MKVAYIHHWSRTATCLQKQRNGCQCSEPRWLGESRYAWSNSEGTFTSSVYGEIMGRSWNIIGQQYRYTRPSCNQTRQWKIPCKYLCMLFEWESHLQFSIAHLIARKVTKKCKYSGFVRRLWHVYTQTDDNPLEMRVSHLSSKPNIRVTLHGYFAEQRCPFRREIARERERERDIRESVRMTRILTVPKVATCSHLLPAAICSHLQTLASSSHLQPLAASACEWLRVAAGVCKCGCTCCEWVQVATCSHLLWSKIFIPRSSPGRFIWRMKIIIMATVIHGIKFGEGTVIIWGCEVVCLQADLLPARIENSLTRHNENMSAIEMKLSNTQSLETATGSWFKAGPRGGRSHSSSQDQVGIACCVYGQEKGWGTQWCFFLSAASLVPVWLWLLFSSVAFPSILALVAKCHPQTHAG